MEGNQGMEQPGVAGADRDDPCRQVAPSTLRRPAFSCRCCRLALRLFGLRVDMSTLIGFGRVCSGARTVTYVASVLATCLLLAAGASNAQAIDVRVEKHGEIVVIDVKAPVAASAGPVWSVLTDYDPMASFMSNVAKSSVLRREAIFSKLLSPARRRWPF